LKEKLRSCRDGREETGRGAEAGMRSVKVIQREDRKKWSSELGLERL
jgi:hypothetical protein